ISYTSRRMKYVVLYVVQEQLESTMKRVNSFPWVKRVELSYKPFLRTEFETKKTDRELEQNY
ncbi:MAG: DUF2129 domain-containing protein, partial [Bacilli bacterium]